MKIAKKVVETVSVTLTEADIRAAIQDYLARNAKLKVTAADIALGKTEHGVFMATITATKDRTPAPAKPRPAADPVPVG